MYFSASMFRSIAGNCYRPDPAARLLSIADGDDAPRGDMLDAPACRIELLVRGSGGMHFYTHPWSGTVRIHIGLATHELNLYSAEAGDVWLPFHAAPDEAVRIAIEPSDHPDPRALGAQVWFLGAELAERQPWQGEVFPLSPHADFRFGRVGSLMVPHHDAVIGQVIKNVGCWAPKDLELFEKLVKVGDVVFDIGANIGHHTVFFSSLVGERGKVIAFEPQQEIFRFASANLALNGCWNTTLMQSCLGGEDGQLYMAPISYEEPNNFGALSVASSTESSGGELVPVWALDSLISSGKIVIDRLDFMKIDVQSFELFVLLGARKAIDQFKPKIFLEIAPHWMKLKGYDYQEIYKLLDDLGYEFTHFDEGAGVEAGIRQWSGEYSEEWDVLCAPRSLSGSPSR